MANESDERFGTEGARKKLPNRSARDFSPREFGEDFKIAGKIPEHLAASAAWAKRNTFGAREGNRLKLAFAFGNRLEESDPLGAHRQTKGTNLDVASGEHTAAFRKQRGSDLKLRVRCERALPSLPGKCDQFSFVHLISRFHGRSLVLCLSMILG